MYTKKDIEKNLNELNYFIDESALSNFIRNWKIDAIYEDEDGIEFYDNLAIAKLKKGISLKAQGYANDQIAYKISKLLPESTGTQIEQKELPMERSTAAARADLQNFTVDVTSQTLQMLAEAVAEKITSGIKNSEFLSQLLPDNTLKSDNEILSKQVSELMEDNKKLARRVEELEQKKAICPINFEFFKKYFK